MFSISCVGSVSNSTAITVAGGSGADARLSCISQNVTRNNYKHLLNARREFEPEWLPPHPVRIESVSGEFVPPIYKGCKGYLRIRSCRPKLIGDLAVPDCKCMIVWEIQRCGTPHMRYLTAFYLPGGRRNQRNRKGVIKGSERNPLGPPKDRFGLEAAFWTRTASSVTKRIVEASQPSG